MCRLKANFGRLAHSMQNARKWEAGRLVRNADFILIAAGDTTTL